MDYVSQTNDQESIFSVRGRLTFNDHAKMRGMIKEMQQGGAKRQVLELSQLEFVDSAGIGMLLIAREELASLERDLVLRGASGQVKRVFTVAQLGKLITIEE